MMDLEQIKDANRIEDIVTEAGYTLRGHGRYLKASEHDSLVVDAKQQYYVWNSKGAGGHSGDVINWLQNEQGMDFRQAVEHLCRRAGVPLAWDGTEAERWKAQRVEFDALTVVARFLQGKLTASAAATAWANGRGWTAETLEQAGCGFWDGDKLGLLDHLRLHQVNASLNVVQAALQMPSDHFVYTHWRSGRCVYLSSRTIRAGDKGKMHASGYPPHYNLRESLVGPRQHYYNAHYQTRAEYVVIVEGQADALTLAQWEIPAVALCGVAAAAELMRRLDGFGRVYIALDADDAGRKNVMALAEQLGPMARVVGWPEDQRIKDANDWLAKAGGTAEDCRLLLASAPIYAIWMCEQAMAASPLKRDAAFDAAVKIVAKLSDYDFERYKKACADALKIGIRELNNMCRSLQKAKTQAAHKVELVLANGYLDEHLFETIRQVDDNGELQGTALAVRRPDGTTTITTRLETDNYRVLPLPPTEKVVSMGTMRLASDLVEYESDVALQQRVQAFIHTYVDIPEEFEKLASYYVMLTWLFDKFYVIPYLRARGDSDSGKSRFTEVVGELCMRALFITGAATPSPVFRTMTRWNGCTVIMDEADLPHSETSADWIQMLNTGYKRGFDLLRTAMTAGEAVVEVFSAFGPKVLNMRGKFADDATESRCLTWHTSSGRAIRDDIERYIQDRDGYYAEAQALRNQLLMFRLRRWRNVTPNYNHEATKHMPGRLVEITVPILSITDEEAFQESIMAFIRDMNRQAIDERYSTLPAKVLEAVLRARYLPDEAALEGPDELLLQVAHITRQTNRVINRENAEASLTEADDEDYKPQKQISVGGVGKILRNSLNLSTTKATIGSRPMILEWDAARINALVIRYGMEDLLLELGEQAYERQQKAKAEEAAQAKQERLLDGKSHK